MLLPEEGEASSLAVPEVVGQGSEDAIYVAPEADYGPAEEADYSRVGEVNYNRVFGEADYNRVGGEADYNRGGEADYNRGGEADYNRGGEADYGQDESQGGEDAEGSGSFAQPQGGGH